MTNEEKIHTHLTAILMKNEETVKLGNDGDYEQIKAVTSDSYEEVVYEISQFIQAITDPENQPNQFGIKL